MARLDDKLDALAPMSPAHLRAEWLTLYQVEPPRLSPELLRHGIAYRLQEKALGKRHCAPRIEIERQPNRAAARIGTQFVRSWNGRTIAVTVCEDGYHWEDRCFASLSAIAREVTGAHWSGPRFFGLPARG